MKLNVGGLSYGIAEEELETLFEAFGTVASVAVTKDRSSSHPKAFGFVEMSDGNEAKAAMTALDGKETSGRNIVVNEACSREDHRSGGGTPHC